MNYLYVYIKNVRLVLITIYTLVFSFTESSLTGKEECSYGDEKLRCLTHPLRTCSPATTTGSSNSLITRISFRPQPAVTEHQYNQVSKRQRHESREDLQAVVTTTIRLRFNFDSTATRLPSDSHSIRLQFDRATTNPQFTSRPSCCAAT